MHEKGDVYMQASLMLDSRSTHPKISDELRGLLTSIGTKRKIGKDSYLFHEGLDANEVYIIKSGLVQISKLSQDGKEFILRICSQDDIIGEMSLFSEEPRYVLNAKVLSPGEVLVINQKQLEDALVTNSRLTIEFMRWTNNERRKLHSKIRDLLLYGKKGALYSTLIRLTNSYGVVQDNGTLINVTLTNQELANFCTATRESINRMLAELKKLDVIAIQKSGKILVKDIDYLKKQICCEGCPIEVCKIN